MWYNAVMENTARRETMTKQYKATTKSGMSIITVQANNLEEARIEIERQLSKNSSRRAALLMWRNAGERIESTSKLAEYLS
jgi:hypothetical protein